jgi:hypothetical protein
MSSKRILRSVLVAVVAVGLVVGPAGAAVAAPDRSEGARVGWLADLAGWVVRAWGGWLSAPEPIEGDSTPTGEQDLPGAENTSCEGCSDGGGGWDPDG